MPPNMKLIYEDKDDKLEYDDAPIEPCTLIGSPGSSISLNKLPIENDDLWKRISWIYRFSGIIYALLASAIFTCAAFTIKMLGVDLLDAFFLRFTIQITAIFIFVRHKGYEIIPGTGIQKFLEFICCATGSGGFFLYFFAMRYVELSDITTIIYTKVIWAFIFSTILYRERPAIGSIIALPLTLFGVILVVQPSFIFSSKIPLIPIVNSRLRTVGLYLTMISSITSAVNVIAFKVVISKTKTVKPSIITFHYCVSVFAFLICYQLYKQLILHNGLTLQYILSWRFILASILGVIVIIPNILSQKAIKREHPAIYTLLGSSDIIFSLILQNIFTSKKSNLFALLGSALVILGVTILGISKILNERSLKKTFELTDVHTVLNDMEENKKNPV